MFCQRKQLSFSITVLIFFCPATYVNISHILYIFYTKIKPHKSFCRFLRKQLLYGGLFSLAILILIFLYRKLPRIEVLIFKFIRLSLCSPFIIKAPFLQGSKKDTPFSIEDVSFLMPLYCFHSQSCLFFLFKLHAQLCKFLCIVSLSALGKIMYV